MATVRKLDAEHYLLDFVDEFGIRRRTKIFGNKRRATAMLAELIAKTQEKQRLGIHTPDEILWEEMVQTWLDLHKRNQRSWDSNKRMLLPYKKVFAGKRLSSIRQKDVENWLQERRNAGLSIATVNRDIAYLKGLFTKAVQYGYLHYSPMSGIWMAKENNKRTRILSDAEEERLFSVIDKPELKLALFLSLRTGMRRGELLPLRHDQVLLEDGLIHMPETKSGEPRTIPMSSSVQAKLENWLSICGSDTWVFPNKDANGPVKDMRTSFGRALRLAKIEDFRWHDLRHTYATRMVRKGANLRSLQLLLGHKDIKTTMRYSNLNMDDLRKSVDLLEDYSPGGNGLAEFPSPPYVLPDKAPSLIH